MFESAELVFCANLVDLVDYSFDGTILVEQNIGYDVLILEVLIT